MLNSTHRVSATAVTLIALLSGGTMLRAQVTSQTAEALRRETASALAALKPLVDQADPRWRQDVPARRAAQSLNAATTRTAALSAELQQRRITPETASRELDDLFEEAVITVWDMYLDEARRGVEAIQARIDDESSKLERQWSQVVEGITANAALSAAEQQARVNAAAPPIAEAERRQLATARTELDGIARRLANARQTLVATVTARATSARDAKRPGGAERFSGLVAEHLESVGPDPSATASSFDQLLASAQLSVPTIVVRGEPQRLGLAERITALAANPVSAPIVDEGPVRYPFVRFDERPPLVFGANKVSPLDRLDGRDLPIPANPGKTAQFLLVTGHRILPTAGAPQLESLEAGIRYTFLAAKDPDVIPIPDSSLRETFDGIYTEATRGLPREAADLTCFFDGVLIRADLDGGVLPGFKRFRINGVEGSWLLERGTSSAALHIVRNIPQRGFETTSDLFIFDTFQVEIRVMEPLSSKSELEVRLMGGDQSLEVQGGTLVAQRDASDPRIFRTPPIYIQGLGSDLPLSKTYPRFVKMQPGVALTALAGLDREFQAPPAAAARISLTPASIGALWKDALREAAEIGKVPVENWNDIGNERVGEISKFVVTEFGSRRVEIKLGHLAGMLLLRKFFIAEMEAYLSKLPEDPDQFPLGAWRKAIAPFMQDPNFAIGSVVVGGGLRDIYSWTEFRNTFDREFLSRRFGGHLGHEYEWVDKTTREAYVGWRQSIADALAESKAIRPNDFKALVQLTGQGFDAVAASLSPRLMRLEQTSNPLGMRWVPDLAARDFVGSIDELADQVRANTALAAASRHVVLSVASLAFFAPASLLTRVVCAVVAAGFAADAGAVTYDYIRSRNELRFADGASAILGEDRIVLAKAHAVPGWVAALSIAGAALGMGAETLQWVQHIRISRTLARAGELMQKLEREGYGAFRAMTPEDGAAILALMTDAKVVRNTPGRTLTPAHRRALQLADDVENARRSKAFLATAEDLRGFRSLTTQQKGDFRSLATIAEKMPAEGMPEPNTVIQGLDDAGRPVQIELGALIGKGVFSHVYELKNFPDRVIKLAVDVFFQGHLVRSGADSVRTAQRVHRMLEQKGIAQLKIHEFHPDAPRPYLIQEKITPQMQRFDLEFGNVDIVYAGQVRGQERVIVGLADGKKLSPAMTRALLRLFKSLGKGPEPIVWEDGHLENICFRPKGATWEAVVLDQDAMVPWNSLQSEPNVLARIRSIEAAPHAKPFRIKSLQDFKVPENYEQLIDGGKSFFPSADFFMEKMLEYGGRYIRYNRDTKQFEGILLDMKIVEEAEFFPNIRNHVDIDLSRTAPRAPSPLEQLFAWLRTVFIPAPQPAWAMP